MNKMQRFLLTGGLEGGLPPLTSDLINIVRSADFILNGDFETRSSPTNWGNFDEFPEGETLVADTTTFYSGASSVKMVIGTTGDPLLAQTKPSGFGNRKIVQLSVYNQSNPAKSSRLSALLTPSNTSFSSSILMSVGSWTRQYLTFIQTTADTGAMFFIGNLSGHRSQTLWMDLFEGFFVDHDSCFALRAGPVDPAVTRCQWIILPNTLAGTVVKADSDIAPLSYLLATHDGVSTIRVYKCLNGTESLQLTVTGVNYVAGANVEFRIPSAGTYQIYYAGTQRGADQVISDPLLDNNYYSGIFSTNEGNVGNGFFQVA
jgi:hypothetical protein